MNQLTAYQKFMQMALKYGFNMGALPKTGQIISYLTGDDGYYKIGIPQSGDRYKDNGDGTITDLCTNLMWVKSPPLMIPGTPGITSQNQIKAVRSNWANTTAYAAGDVVQAIDMEQGAINASRATQTITATGGAPFSLADLNKPMFINNVDQGVVVEYISTTQVKVWNSGTTGSNPLSKKGFYVCIVPHTSNTGGIFGTDLAAGFWRLTIWRQNATNLTGISSNSIHQWALPACEALEYAGYSNWRVPNILEVISLRLQDTGSSPYYIHPLFQQAGTTGKHWSSTASTAVTTSKYCLEFSSGLITAVAQTVATTFRPVRGGN